MKGRRITFELLELYDWQGVERRLERQAAKGWRLEKIVFPLLVLPRRAKPAQVRYAVTYLPNVGEATPRPDPEAQALDAVCTAAGWEKICDWNGMQIFSNEQPDPLPLENGRTPAPAGHPPNVETAMDGPDGPPRRTAIPFAFVLLGRAGVRANTIHLARDALLRCAVPGI